ncbi:MAG: DUF4397 domain-containing protein [Bacilli bacterium]|nr:DUF4397 domain-containing protein [Bacilli bacterium]
MDYYQQFPRPVNIRFVNELMPMQMVDIFINDSPAIRGLMVRQVTQPIPIPMGNYNFKVYQSGTNQLLVNQNLQIDRNSLIRIAMEANRVILKVTDDMMDQMMPYGMPMNYGQMPMPQCPQMNQRRDTEVMGQSRIRFINLSPNAPSLDITTPTGIALFRNVPYRATTDYLNLASGVHNLQVREAGTDRILLTIPNVVLNPNDVKTIYAIGLVGGTPMFEVIILDDNIL